MDEPKHLNYGMANQVVEWYQLDSKELYERNLAQAKSTLEKFGWIDQTITYRFNQQGFRADEFDVAGPRAVFLGCSHTFGIGLPNELTWPYLVSANLGYNNFNLGVGGSSNDTAFRLAQYWLPLLKPHVVVFLSTEPTRMELHTANGDTWDLSVWNKWSDTETFYRHWVTNHVNTAMNMSKNQLAIKQLCADIGARYVHETFDGFTHLHVDRARDLHHYGQESNQRLADRILSKL